MAAGRPQPVPATLAPEVPSLRALAERWTSAREGVLAPNTIAEVETDVRLRLAPVLGDLRIDEITRQQIDELVARLLRAGASVRMLRGTVGSLRRLLQAGVEWGHLAANPARHLRLPAPATHLRQAHERVLSVDELKQLIAACRGSLRTETLIRAMAEAGLRRGEVISLHWEDLDLAGLRLQVRRNVTETRRVRAERTTKGTRARRVAISAGFADRLAAWRAHAGGERARGYVWPGQNGGPMNAHSSNQALARALVRAGLVDEHGVPLVSPHALRHTAASLMLAAGVPLIVVSRQLGHANPNVTAQVYAHLLSDSQLDQAADAFRSLGVALEDVGQDVVGRIARRPRPDIAHNSADRTSSHG